MLEPDRVAYSFTLLHELPEVEFKGPGRARRERSPPLVCPFRGLPATISALLRCITFHFSDRPKEW